MESAYSRGVARKRVTATFTTTDTNVCDAGVGNSFVGIQIHTALAAGSTLTFKGYGGGDLLTSAPASTLLDSVKIENNDGTAAAAYTIEAGTDTGYFPLDAAVFNGCRFLQVISDVSNAAATIELIAKEI